MTLTFDLGRGPQSFGHRFLIGLQQSPVLSDHDKRLLALLKPAGVVLFRANFLSDAPYDEWLASHARLLADVREYIGRDEIIVSIDPEAFRKRELAAFRPFTDARTRLFMTAHIVVLKIDPGMPATMSRIILNDILRQELGFRGVIVTDDLGMRAISAKLKEPETTIRIVNAGADLLCMCAYWADTSLILEMVAHMSDGLKN